MVVAGAAERFSGAALAGSAYLFQASLVRVRVMVLCW